MEENLILKAIEALSKGKIVVYPTDTLYGLGADIFNKDALNKIYSVKKRPYNMPLSVAVSNLKELKKIAYVDNRTELLINKFLPGKLSLILKKKDHILDLLTANSKKIAVRMPDNDIALNIISKFGPITATSANIHNLKTPSIIKEISMQFKEDDIAVYIDDGKLVGKHSTIVDMTGKEIKIVRKGFIEKKDILDAISNE